jgi:archaellum component FlaG (FlaF/FlaG flagellin family)
MGRKETTTFSRRKNPNAAARLLAFIIVVVFAALVLGLLTNAALNGKPAWKRKSPGDVA